jgi:hypothetical protein
MGDLACAVVPIVIRRAARPVVRAEALAVRVVPDARVAELGSVLDLVLRAVDEHLLLDLVDPGHDPGGNQDLPAEDPRTRVDHDVAAADVVGSLVHLADRASSALDAEAGDVGMGPVTFEPSSCLSRNVQTFCVLVTCCMSCLLVEG